MSASARPRVLVRSPRPDDADEFILRVRRSRSTHRPWAYLTPSRQAFIALLERSRAPTEEVFFVCRTEDDAIVGMATLSQISLGNFRSAYLGYSAFAPFQGLGYMSEGIRLVLRRAFGRIGLHRVEANVQPDNARSIALLERLGFRREGYSPRYLKIGGRWRDHVRYAILAEEAFPTPSRRSPRPPPPSGRTPPRTGPAQGARGAGRRRP